MRGVRDSQAEARGEPVPPPQVRQPASAVTHGTAGRPNIPATPVTPPVSVARPSPAVPPTPVVQAARPLAAPAAQVLTTASGVALANASLRAVDAARQGVAHWAREHNAPEVLATADLSGNGVPDVATLDMNNNGVIDNADQVVFGGLAEQAVEDGNSMVDEIAEWFS